MIDKACYVKATVRVNRMRDMIQGFAGSDAGMMMHLSKYDSLGRTICNRFLEGNPFRQASEDVNSGK